MGMRPTYNDQMLTIRRNDYTPRIEMMPLIDVIFLLLTFFIYSMMVMLHAEILPVSLVPVGTGQRGDAAQVQVITINRDGQLFFNRQQVVDEELDRLLADLAADANAPRLYLTVEAEGRVDRGPLFVNLLERVRAAGIENFAIVGQPADKPGDDDP